MIVKFRWVFFALFLAIVFGAAYLAFRNGVFKPVNFDQQITGLPPALYKEHIGPYHKILPTLNEVEAFAKTVGADCVQSFGEFIDDPNSTEAERLRADVGCLVSPTVIEAKDFAEKAKAAGILVKRFPTRAYLIAQFAGSPALGPVKVYSKMEAELRERRLQIDGHPIEVYRLLESGGLETRYLFPVKN